MGVFKPRLGTGVVSSLVGVALVAGGLLTPAMNPIGRVLADTTCPTGAVCSIQQMTTISSTANPNTPITIAVAAPPPPAGIDCTVTACLPPLTFTITPGSQLLGTSISVVYGSDGTFSLTITDTATGQPIAIINLLTGLTLALPNSFALQEYVNGAWVSLVATAASQIANLQASVGAMSHAVGAAGVSAGVSASTVKAVGVRYWTIPSPGIYRVVPATSVVLPTPLPTVAPTPSSVTPPVISVPVRSRVLPKAVCPSCKAALRLTWTDGMTAKSLKATDKIYSLSGTHGTFIVSATAPSTKTRGMWSALKDWSDTPITVSLPKGYVLQMENKAGKWVTTSSSAITGPGTYRIAKASTSTK